MMGCWIAFVGNSTSYPLLEFPRFTPQTGRANAKVSAAAGCGCLTQFLRQLSIALFARESQHKSKGLKDPWVSAEKMNGVLWRRESAKINRSLVFFFCCCFVLVNPASLRVSFFWTGNIDVSLSVPSGKPVISVAGPNKFWPTKA